MPAEPIRQSAVALDLSPRVVTTTAVTGSPAAAAETIVSTLPAITSNIIATLGVLIGFTIAWTVGTSGTAATFRIRQTGLAGTVIFNSGAITVAATNLRCDDVFGIDAASVLPGQVYVCTLQVTAGAAASTVSATSGFALVV